MPTNDGLTAYECYIARTESVAAGMQMKSATINGMQDGIILVSNKLDDAASKLFLSKMATCNQSDAVAPQTYGGRTVWFHKESAATTSEVVLDTAIDWRDRLVEVALSYFDRSSGAEWATAAPGEADDEHLNLATISYHQHFYAQEGQDGTHNEPGVQNQPDSGDYHRLYARDTDGALCMRRSATADPLFYVVGRITCSPKLNIYPA